jgi:hypothetical protein
MPGLTLDAPSIDGRTLADLLDYFTQLSGHINYYDTNMVVSDWRDFFSRSVPFNLAAISKYKADAIGEKFEFYQSLLLKRPGKSTLQLLVHYMYYSTIYRINTWYNTVKGSGLPFESLLQNLVQERLQDSVRSFIALANAAAREQCIKNIDFSALLSNNLWNLSAADLLRVDNSSRPRRGRRTRIIGLMNALVALWPSFIEGIKLLGSVAGDSIEDSLFKQPENLKQQHTPHLALLFAFLKLFQHLQSDLNSFTRKHLDFFFRDILRLAPRPAEPDKAYLVFEIQKQLDEYLLTKGLLIKDAKDKKNVEIQFGLDDEIVVNKTQVEEVRTLFLQNELAHDDMKVRLLPGVYMAPKADKADGLTKDFADGNPTNWPTLGARLSKFTDVGKTTSQPYPFARIGFVLASPVLLLNEGLRTVSIQLYCRKNDNCIIDHEPNMLVQFLAALQLAMGDTYIIVTKDLIDEAGKKGISPATITKLTNLLPLIPKETCCPDDQLSREERVQLLKAKWLTDIINTVVAAEQTILKTLFIERRVFKISFSGKTAWIDPTTIDLLSIEPKGVDYLIRITATLDEARPAVTFFNKEALKEDFETTLPLVKIELDPEIMIAYPGMPASQNPEAHCCFENCHTTGDQYISLYQFFRQLTLAQGTIPDDTQIQVQVCGLKNFVVENDDNVMDINGPIYPFGTRPEVAGFDLMNLPIVAPPSTAIGPGFYIGSKEIFCKKWRDVRVNLNWKDKPANFNDYYRAYWADPANPNVTFGLDENNFEIKLAFLRNGQWVPEAGLRKLFATTPSTPLCAPASDFGQTIDITYNTALLHTPYFSVDDLPQQGHDLERNGFIRINLTGQDFMHKAYAFVLARQMMAFGRAPDIVEGAVYSKDGNSIIVFTGLAGALFGLDGSIAANTTDADITKGNATDLDTTFTSFTIGPNPSVSDPERDILKIKVQQTKTAAETGATQAADVVNKYNALRDLSGLFDPLHPHNLTSKLQTLIPNEPWTPIIKNISLDYVATAALDDMDLIHLYPYDNTHKKEEATLQPALFPTYCDEGSLFIGLKQLVPGNDLNILFQLAEATANSEVDPAEVLWHYLSGNQWKPLRKGFEVLDDGTSGLTTSGIVKLAIPANINTANTIMPKELHWIKASATLNVLAVSETIGIHTQAMSATFVNTPDHDQLRLGAPLEANKLSKLLVADSSVKKVAQPYASFGGSVPEGEGNYYIRVSELLRHKGRGIQKFDYERLVLDAFPEIYKVKCVNHDFWLDATRYRMDVTAAPGYVMIAVIPDLRRLESGRSFEPKAPVSVLEKITAYLKSRTSPFARIKVTNPRYEKLDLRITVQLLKGKDKVFYKSKLESDLRLFLAPWAVGEFDKLSFGQCINRSDIVRFIEARNYVDYIICLEMFFKRDCDSGLSTELNEVCPLTPRSILVGGFIDICIPEADCEKWAPGADECSKSFKITEVECRELPPLK